MGKRTNSSTGGMGFGKTRSGGKVIQVSRCIWNKMKARVIPQGKQDASEGGFGVAKKMVDRAFKGEQ